MPQNCPPQVPIGKYNKWCERRSLVCCDEEKDSRANRYVGDNTLTESEKAAFYVHELVDCQGLEFVVFSSARINQYVVLPGNIVIAPCFATESGATNSLIVQCTREMERRGCFVYDGWLPIADWNKDSVRKAISLIDSALSLFTLRVSTWLSWEPKYSPFQKDGKWHEFNQVDVRQLDQLIESMKQLDEADARALLNSIVWLSQSVRLEQPPAKFLFGILAIESLGNYIEEESSDNSIFNRLRCTQMTKHQLKEERQACVGDIMGQFLDTDPEGAVKSAYFDCIIGIKKRLQAHLTNVFQDNTEPVELLFNTKVDGKTLYELRSHIAHGKIDMLSEQQRETINLRAWDVERIARDYLLKVVMTVTGQALPEAEILEVTSGHLENCIIFHEGRYEGPIHMAEVYSSSYRGFITGMS